MECTGCGKGIKKAVAKGLCSACYCKDIKARSMGVCKGCGDSKPIKSKGYCGACYAAFLRYGDATHRERPVKGAKMCSKCEREPVHAKGLCKSCYGRKKLKTLGHGECKECGEFKKLMARDLCPKCYAKDIEKSKSAICKGCGLLKPIKAQRMCRKCYMRAQRHGHTNYTRPTKGTKLCPRCGKKPIHAKGLCSACYSRMKMKENPGKWVNSKLLKQYGITSEIYDAILKSQDNRCAICGIDSNEVVNGKNTRFAVDHDHETGDIRGLLCGNCNRSLGGLKDSPQLLQNAISYLNQHTPSGV